jgi:flagellar hook-associated protein 1 FlgK
VYDEFLVRESVSGQAAWAQDRTRGTQLDRLDRLFADADTGIGAAVDELMGAMADVVNRPFDRSARAAVLARADGFAERARTLDARLSELRDATQSQMQTEVGKANGVLASLAAVNRQIADLRGSGHAPNNLLDQRDRLLGELNGIVKANSVIAADGTVTVQSLRGEALVVGAKASRLSLVDDPTVPGRLGVTIVRDTGIPMRMEAADLGGGSLAGLMRFRDEDLEATRTRLGGIVTAFATALNAQQARGLDATGAAGEPLFALGTTLAELRALQTNPDRLATALPVSTETGAANAGDLKASAVSIGAIGPDTAQPVTLTFTGPGTFDVSGTGTGNPTGLAFTPGMQVSYNGWTATLSGTPAAGDTLRIVATASASTDNRNARAMQALGDAPVVDGTTKVVDAYASLVGEVGTRTQSARAAGDMSKRLFDEAERSRTELSGVNLDEEAARLMQYQQAYQAAAKVIETANEMFRTLLQAAG